MASIKKINNVLYNRKVRVTLALPLTGSFVESGAPVMRFEDLRITFEAVQSLDKDPNTANITIYNLNAEQRSYLSEKGIRVVLEAGYDENFNTIFFGDLSSSRSYKEGPDWLTELECKDGGRTVKNSTAFRSFRKGVKAKKVVKYLIEAMGLTATAGTKAVVEAMTDEYTNGKVLSGKAANQLDRILADHGLEWSIQNGRLQILKYGTVEDRTVFVFLSKDTGLVGSPEEGAPDKKRGPKKYTAKSLLQPGLTPGKLVSLQSIVLEEDVVVDKVTHTGDNFGTEWYSLIEGFLYNIR